MAKAKPFITVDCETDPFAPGRVPAPFVWGVYDGKDFRYWWGDDCTKHVVDYLKTRDVMAYAHNGGRFDWHFLADYIEPGTRMTVINGRIGSVKLGRSTLRDSWNLAPVPLSAIQKDEIDYRKLESDVRDKHREEIIRYLRGDCVYLYDYLAGYFDRFGRHLTIASSSLAQWRKISGEKPPKTSRRYFDMLRPYYYGGRCQAFDRGVFDGDYTIVDINSAYPYAMQFYHPYGAAYRVLPRSKMDLVSLSDERRRFYTVRGVNRGALPFRSEDGSLSFEKESGTFTVTDWELHAGLDTDTFEIDEIETVIEFDVTRTFSEYVNTFYQMKLEAERAGDKARRTWAKLFMNSLYGKFAANPRKYKEYLIEEAGYSKLQDGDSVWLPGAPFGKHQLYQRDLPEEKHVYYNIATSASITGFVRAMLWRAILASKGVLYCDTDSIICRETSVTIGEELGQWSIDGYADRIAVAGKKLYAAWKDGRVVKQANKGVRISAAEILKVAEGGTVRYVSDTPTFSIQRGTVFVSRQVKPT